MNQVKRYVTSLIRVHVRYWFLHLLLLLLMPILGLLALFTGLAMEATSGNTDAASWVMVVVFSCTSSLVILLANAVAASEWASLQGFSQKLGWFLLNQGLTMSWFAAVSFLLFAYDGW